MKWQCHHTVAMRPQYHNTVAIWLHSDTWSVTIQYSHDVTQWHSVTIQYLWGYTQWHVTMHTVPIWGHTVSPYNTYMRLHSDRGHHGIQYLNEATQWQCHHTIPIWGYTVTQCHHGIQYVYEATRWHSVTILYLYEATQWHSVTIWGMRLQWHSVIIL